MKIGDRVTLKIRDKHRTKVQGIISDVYNEGRKCQVNLGGGYKCWAWTKDVTKVV